MRWPQVDGADLGLADLVSKFGLPFLVTCLDLIDDCIRHGPFCAGEKYALDAKEKPGRSLENWAQVHVTRDPETRVNLANVPELLENP